MGPGPYEPGPVPYGLARQPLELLLLAPSLWLPFLEIAADFSVGLLTSERSQRKSTWLLVLVPAGRGLQPDHYMYRAPER